VTLCRAGAVVGRRGKVTYDSEMIRRLLLNPRITLGVAATAAFVLGAMYVIAPGVALERYGFDKPEEVWIRLVGVLAIAIGVLHAAGTIANERWYYLATVAERVLAGLLQIGLAVAIGPWQLAAFGSLDIAGASWTAVALAAQSRDQNVRAIELEERVSP
jgi:hypothetical protein